jgi:predicted PurR-regulated permease PerM
MEKIIQYVRLLLLLSIVALVLLIVWFFTMTAPQLQQEIKDVDSTTRTINGAANTLRQAAVQWRDASKKSSDISDQTVLVLQNTAQAMGRLNTTAGDLDSLVRKTNDSLNDKLFPELTQAASQTTTLTQQLTVTAEQSTEAMKQATETLADAGKILGDPANQQTAKNLSIATNNAVEATKNLAGITEDGKKVADHYTQEILKPTKKIILVAKAAANYISIFFGAYLGAH